MCTPCAAVSLAIGVTLFVDDFPVSSGGTVAQNLHLCQYPLSRVFLVLLSIMDPMPDNESSSIGSSNKGPCVLHFFFQSCLNVEKA